MPMYTSMEFGDVLVHRSTVIVTLSVIPVRLPLKIVPCAVPVSIKILSTDRLPTR